MSSDSSSDCEFYYASIKQIAFGIASKNIDEGDGFWQSKAKLLLCTRKQRIPWLLV